MIKYSENAEATYKKLYLHNEENIEDCHKRVADFVGNDQDEMDTFKGMLDAKIIRVNTPCMTNAGVKLNPNLAACFILGLNDSMSSIIDMWGTCARIYEGGGGAGIPITNLRGEGSPISSGGFASGPLSYSKVVQSISEQVKSGGRSRRAANHIVFKEDHPDTDRLIGCKEDGKSFSAINLSMLTTNLFMGLKKDPITKQHNRWKNLTYQAHLRGGPGLLFYDRINRDNPFPLRTDIVCANPCGEIVGMPWTSCILGHLNLNMFLKRAPNGHYSIDWLEFSEAIKIGVLMLNRMIDKTNHPHQQFKRVMESTRPIGLGIMGLADVLYKLGIPYGSDIALDIVESITQFLTVTAFRSSIELAHEGKIPSIKFRNAAELKAFQKYASQFIGPELVDQIPNGIGNSTVTTIAPTGSTSLSADCSYGFEPEMALIWNKELENGETWPMLNRIFLDVCGDRGMHITDMMMESIMEHKGSIQHLHVIPEDMRKTFVTAHDIHWRDRIKMQAAAQKYITMSISSTVNLPNSATVEDVDDIYTYAYEQGLKGITIYRDGCLDDQPVNFGGSKKPEQDMLGVLDPMTHHPVERPPVRTGKTVEVKAPNGKLYVTGNEWDGSLKEVFISMSKQDSRINHLLNSFGRIISKSLQYGVPIDVLLDSMRGGGGEVFFLKLPNRPNSIRVSGIIDATAYLIDDEFIPEEPIDLPLVDVEAYLAEIKETCDDSKCPECGRLTFRRDGACRGGFCTHPKCLFSNCS